VHQFSRFINKGLIKNNFPRLNTFSGKLDFLSWSKAIVPLGAGFGALDA
jgi:hypothetical protein